MNSHRIRRVESLLAEEIGRLIVEKEIKDPRVSTLLSVTGVTVSKDLAYAKVRVSGYLSRKRLDKGVAGLNRAAGFVQARLGKKLSFRTTPRLTFVADHSIEEGFEVDRQLKEALG